MSKVQDDGAVYDDINITPMLDLSYVLLVIFILMTTASVQGIKINLPKASNTPSLAKPLTKAITITQNGSLYLDAYPMASLQELESRLSAIKATSKDFPIVVKGDSAVQYEKVVEVLDLLGRLDLNQIGLVTQRLVK
jgi:biopolymer transport protein ExbD